MSFSFSHISCLSIETGRVRLDTHVTHTGLMATNPFVPDLSSVRLLDVSGRKWGLYCLGLLWAFLSMTSNGSRLFNITSLPQVVLPRGFGRLVWEIWSEARWVLPWEQRAWLTLQECQENNSKQMQMSDQSGSLGKEPGFSSYSTFWGSQGCVWVCVSLLSLPSFLSSCCLINTLLSFMSFLPVLFPLSPVLLNPPPAPVPHHSVSIKEASFFMN